MSHLTLCYSVIDFKLTELKSKVCSENSKNIEENKLGKFIWIVGFKFVYLQIQIVA
jgi:hypothetical protein